MGGPPLLFCSLSLWDPINYWLLRTPILETITLAGCECNYKDLLFLSLKVASLGLSQRVFKKSIQSDWSKWGKWKPLSAEKSPVGLALGSRLLFSNVQCPQSQSTWLHPEAPVPALLWCEAVHLALPAGATKLSPEGSKLLPHTAQHRRSWPGCHTLGWVLLLVSLIRDDSRSFPYRKHREVVAESPKEAWLPAYQKKGCRVTDTLCPIRGIYTRSHTLHLRILATWLAVLNVSAPWETCTLTLY